MWQSNLYGKLIFRSVDTLSSIDHPANPTALSLPRPIFSPFINKGKCTESPRFQVSMVISANNCTVMYRLKKKWRKKFSQKIELTNTNGYVSELKVYTKKIHI